jgi:hypothetical protein
LINIIQPVEAITTALCGDKYFTASMVVSQVACMLVHLRLMVITERSLKELKKKLINSIEIRFADIES